MNYSLFFFLNQILCVVSFVGICVLWAFMSLRAKNRFETAEELLAPANETPNKRLILNTIDHFIDADLDAKPSNSFHRKLQDEFLRLSKKAR